MFLKGNLGQETKEATDVSTCYSNWLERPVDERFSNPSLHCKLEECSTMKADEKGQPSFHFFPLMTLGPLW